MLIELKNAGRRYNQNWIFRQLNINISHSAKLAILGPNGSGKSTLLQVLSGYLSLSEGSLQLITEGKKIDSESIFRFISLAAPYIELIEEFNLSELLEFQLNLKGSFNRLSLQDWVERSELKQTGILRIKFFSSGMKQRLKLLLAFASDCPIILLDEPLTNLDDQGLKWYHSLLKDFAFERIIIIASNNPEEYEFCDQRIHINEYHRQPI